MKNGETIFLFTLLVGKMKFLSKCFNLGKNSFEIKQLSKSASFDKA